MLNQTIIMKKAFLLLVLIPLLGITQSKKKLLKAEKQATQVLVAHLRDNVKYLADDKLEGRRTGTKGELLAMHYLVEQYKQIGLEPKGTDGFVQEFTIDEGKQADGENTYFIAEGKKLELNTDFFPLAFSA